MLRTLLLSKLTAELMKAKGALQQRFCCCISGQNSVPKLTEYPSLHPEHTQDMMNSEERVNDYCFYRFFKTTKQCLTTAASLSHFSLKDKIEGGGGEGGG